MTTDNRIPVRRQDYQPPRYTVDSLQLWFDLGEDVTRVRSRMQLCRQDASDDHSVVLDGVALALQWVKCDGRQLSAEEYQVTETHLRVKSVPRNCVLETEVLIYPHQNRCLSGLYVSKGLFCTQNEAHGFRRITYFFDRPDVLTTYQTTITAPTELASVLLANGNCEQDQLLDDGRRQVVWVDPSRKPCYLFACVAGHLDVIEDSFVTCSGRPVALRLYVEPAFIDQGQFALEALKRAMKWDEQRWGREYDLDIYMIVAVSDFNFGAMENKGLNLFNAACVLANPQMATDQDFYKIESIIAHEYFHNWSGNRVTCRDWFEITLKEGLTVFRDQSFSADVFDETMARISELAILRSKQFEEDAGPNAHPIRPDSYYAVDNLYTTTVYQKGAEVIRMVETILGREAFRQGLDAYFERYDGQAVRTDDFIAIMEESSQLDLSQFRRWYAQVGTPTVSIELAYDAASQLCTVQMQQDSRMDEPLHIPIRLGMIGQQTGDSLTWGDQQECERVCQLTEFQQSYSFESVSQPPILSVLRGGSAPVKIEMALSFTDCCQLIRHDSDVVVRWDAQQRAVGLLVDRMITGQQPVEWLNQLLEVFQGVLMDQSSLSMMRAYLLTLPSYQYFMAHGKDVDPQKLHSVLMELRRYFAHQLYEHWLRVAAIAEPECYSYDAQSVGRRALRDCALGYLGYCDSSEALELIVSTYDRASHMSDRFGALLAINHHATEKRNELLGNFYERYYSEPLLINKWLSLQAISHREDTPACVAELLGHEAFALENPNNVYALLGGLSSNVPVFHQESGQLYDFLAEQVVKIDRFNPHVAARMVRPLLAKKSLAPCYARAMDAAVEMLMREKGLSAQTAEIVMAAR